MVVPRGSCSRRITKLIAARLGDELEFLESRKKSEGKFPRQIFLCFLRTKQIRTNTRFRKFFFFFFEIFLLNLSGVNQRPCLEDSVKFAPLKGKRTPLIPEILLHGSLGSPASLPSCNPVKNEIVASTWRSNDPHVLADKVYDVFPALLFPSPILSLPAAFFYPLPLVLASRRYKSPPARRRDFFEKERKTRICDSLSTKITRGFLMCMETSEDDAPPSFLPPPPPSFSPLLRMGMKTNEGGRSIYFCEFPVFNFRYAINDD